MEVSMQVKTLFTAKNIAYLAILLALVIVLQTFGGTIVIGGVVQLNFTLVPIVLGAVLLGPTAGGILGLACGIVVMIQVIMGLSPFYTVIWTENPVVAALTCVVKTTVAGYVAGWVYRWIAKKSKIVATFVAAGLVPVLNTGLFILGCLCMSNAIVVFGSENGMQLSGSDILVFILVGLVTFNFFIEFALNLLLAPVIERVVSVTEKLIGKKRAKRSA